MNSTQKQPLRLGERPQRRACLLALTALAAAALVACGGSDDAAAPAVPVAAEPVPVKTAEALVRVVDGALEKALGCVDANANANANGACDDGETRACTDADGNARLTLPAADVGKFGVLAIVPVGASDKAHGEVKVAYVMRSPAAAATLISPLLPLSPSIRPALGPTANAKPCRTGPLSWPKQPA